MAAPTPLAPVPAHIGGIDPAFAYHQKVVRPGEVLSLSSAVLKWYGIARPGVDLAALEAEGRAFLAYEVDRGGLRLEDRLGFVELHHCADVAFLIVCTWNHENELWQSVFVKNLAAASPFERVNRQNAGHRPTLCVWELVPVCHERDAWVRYLRSARTEADKVTYLRDRFEGLC